jgi:hypothetical protein
MQHDYEPIWRLTHRLYPAFSRLIRYLQTTPDPDFSNKTRLRGRRTEHTPTDPKSHRTNAESTRTDSQPHRTDPNTSRTDR